MKNIFNISPAYSFLEVFGNYVIDTAKQNNQNIANDIILLPTKRSCRGLREVFLTLSKKENTILPKILALGDIDEDGFAFLDYENTNIDNFELPPSISNLERNLILARLIKAKSIYTNDEQAYALAVDLAHLIDTVEMEMQSFDNLANIVPEHYSEYWQETLEFLKIITEFYPRILQERGLMNPVSRKIKLIYKQVEVWNSFPPKGRIFAGGSTGSLVPVAYMLRAISNMKNGNIILSGLDTVISKDDFERVGQNHPQYGLRNLLASMEVRREDIIELHPTTSQPSPKKTDKEILSSFIMLDSKMNENWQTMPAISENVLDGVNKLSLKTEADESIAIALIIREALEEKKKTLLITPDRKIAKSVASELKRWNIIVDDSAGTPASETDTGNYIILVLNAIINDFSPFELLGVLKHKFTHLGYNKKDLDSIVNNLEKYILRGEFGLDNLEKIKSRTEEKKLEKSEIIISPILNLITSIETIIKDFKSFLKDKGQEFSLYDLIFTHLNIIERFVENDMKEQGFINNTLYSGDINTQLVDELKSLLFTLEKLKNNNEDIDKIKAKFYQSFISQYFFNIKLRSTMNAHPQIAIMNSIEARLLDADLFIMSGLNEQTFPSITSDDPWMSRPMKKEFKLPLPERKIGLSSHDFIEFFNKKNVIMTRAIKVEGKNTIESRWLQKLDAIIEIKKIKFNNTYANKILDWIEKIDTSTASVKCERPSPTPPIEARPKELWATSLEKLYRDPYIIYANKILKLKKLDDIDLDVMQADFGNIIHNSLEEFKNKKLENYTELMEIILRNALPYKDLDTVDFWYTKFENIASWFIDYEASIKDFTSHSYQEITGELKITETFTLKAKADRIDILSGGNLAIITDYKSGSAPKKKEVIEGYAPQLPLEALILNAGGFKDIMGKVKTAELKYLELNNKKEISYNNDNLENNLANILEQTHNILRETIEKFAIETTPYISRPNPNKVGNTIKEYSEYTHLARVKEWSDE